MTAPPAAPPTAATEAARATAPPAAGDRVWTALDLLRWTTDYFSSRGIDTARLDAECLLAHALGVDRVRLYIDFEKPVSTEERSGFRELVRRRGTDRVPVSHLIGSREFWSLPLFVSPDVLTPRPDTETLVQVALDQIAVKTPLILDMGTGSGAIALALLSELPNAHVGATDVSSVALAVARKNADVHGFADRIEFREGSLFEPVACERFDIVVSNPPYLAEVNRSQLPPELDHEPDVALFAGSAGLDVLRDLWAGVADVLVPGGVAAFELSSEQVPAVSDGLRDAGLADVMCFRDFEDRPRVVAGRKPAVSAGGV